MPPTIAQGRQSEAWGRLNGTAQLVLGLDWLALVVTERDRQALGELRLGGLRRLGSVVPGGSRLLPGATTSFGLADSNRENFQGWPQVQKRSRR